MSSKDHVGPFGYGDPDEQMMKLCKKTRFHNEESMLSKSKGRNRGSFQGNSAAKRLSRDIHYSILLGMIIVQATLQ